MTVLRTIDVPISPPRFISAHHPTLNGDPAHWLMCIHNIRIEELPMGRVRVKARGWTQIPEIEKTLVDHKCEDIYVYDHEVTDSSASIIDDNDMFFITTEHPTYHSRDMRTWHAIITSVETGFNTIHMSALRGTAIIRNRSFQKKFELDLCRNIRIFRRGRRIFNVRKFFIWLAVQATIRNWPMTPTTSTRHLCLLLRFLLTRRNDSAWEPGQTQSMAE